MSFNLDERIYTQEGVETIEGIKNWCRIDATFGKIPIKEQIKSAIKVFKKSRKFATNAMISAAEELS